MANKIDMEFMQLLNDDDVKVLINSFDAEIMLQPFKQKSRKYAKYMSRLGNLSKKSPLVRKNLPIIVFDLYQHNDYDIWTMISLNANILKGVFLAALEECHITLEELCDKTAEETVDFLMEYDKEKNNNVDLSLFLVQLKMNGIVFEDEKVREITGLWMGYQTKTDAEEGQKREEENAWKEMEDAYKLQIRNQKKEFESKLSKAESARKQAEKDNKTKDRRINELEQDLQKWKDTSESLKKECAAQQEIIEENKRKIEELNQELTDIKKQIVQEEKSFEEINHEQENCDMRRGKNMDEINVSNYIIIDEADATLDRLHQFSGIYSIELEEIVDFIKTEENTYFYLDEKMNVKTENDRGIKYLWLDTGLESYKDGKPLFISLLPQDGYFIGHYVGDWKFLSNLILQYFPANSRMIRENVDRFRIKYEKRIAKRQLQHLTGQYKIEENIEETVEEKTEDIKQPAAHNITIPDTYIERKNDYEEVNEHIPPVPREITNDVLSMLMINNWKTKEGLDRYLKVIGCRLQQLVEQNKKDYYILNNIKSAVANTGLLNQFGADIHILYRYYVSSNVYVAYKIMESKTDYLENGFTKEQISQTILPVNFFDEGEELFVATMDDFDVNHRSLLHIIEERRERFPQNVADLSANMIATKINNALELGLKMQKRDRNYAKPSYSTKNKTISWMMPLHINRELTEEPELVLVIRRNKEFYEIKTIIPYDDEMKDRLTALSLYNGLW